MENWTEGYVVDIDYTYSFFEELDPTWIIFALAQKGFAPPNHEKFNYCELGFGQGFGTNLFAALNPQGEFWATDFNPSHTCEAQRLADEAGSKNVYFYDKSFEEFLNTDTPQFDFIVLHGIYSWISDKNQNIIVEILRRKLKVGGAVYISYNTMPGWAAASPLQKLMFEYAAQTKEPTLNQIEKTVAFVDKLKELKAGFFTANPVAGQQLGTILKFKESRSNYLIHEYLNHHWQPLYFFEVARRLADAKLTFATSAILADQFVSQRFSQEQQQLLAEVTVPELRETVQDYFVNRYFRKDIFVRGLRRLKPQERTEILGKFGFTLVLPSLEDVKYEVQMAGITITFQEDIFKPLLAELAEGRKTIAELLQKPQIEEKIGNFTNAIDVLTLLIAIGYVRPSLPLENEVDRQKRTTEFNRAVMERARYGAELQAFASPVIGGGIGTNRIEQLFLLAYKRQIDPIPLVMEVLQASGQRLMKEERILEAEDEIKTELEERWQAFKSDRLPILEKWGVI
jgi:predicted O-methyltransferase YrrM